MNEAIGTWFVTLSIHVYTRIPGEGRGPHPLENLHGKLPKLGPGPPSKQKYPSEPPFWKQKFWIRPWRMLHIVHVGLHVVFWDIYIHIFVLKMHEGSVRLQQDNLFNETRPVYM